jgi:predicted nuclease with TOPRIM domain
MADESEELHARLASLEVEHAELREASAETKQRYTSLLHMMKELTANAVEASTRAAASAEKSLLASQQAALAAKEAAVAGAMQVADAALTAPKAAADAAEEAAIAFMEAWTAALVAAGHNANMELLAMSSKASKSSRDVAAFAKEALHVFVDAFEAVKRATARAV